MKKLLIVAVALLMNSSVWAADGVRISFLNTQRVLTVSQTVLKGNADIAIENALGDVEDYIYDMGYTPSGSPFSRILNETPTTYLIQAGYPVSAAFPGSGNGYVQASYLPGGRVLSTLHLASEGSVVFAYNRLESFMDFNGYFSTSAPWEVYLDDAGMQTMVYWPVSQIAP